MNVEIFENIRFGICALGYFSQKPTKEKIAQMVADFKIIGTGFLVDDGIVITNRHVIKKLKEIQKKKRIPKKQVFLEFVDRVPKKANQWSTSFCRLDIISHSDDPDLDIGLISVRGGKDDPSLKIKTLKIKKDYSIFVGQEIGVSGYAYGQELLSREGVTYRFGPILQQGYVSAIAPFDGAGGVREILLDIRTAPGMSGSPVFRKFDGAVIGIHHKGIDPVTQFAIPLDPEKVKEWIKKHKSKMKY